MGSPPAPPLTAFVASSIWSGVGEVNTSPGQAASSIPGPTKPPCIASWPRPPPGEAAVHRLVTRAAAGDDPHLALDRGVRTDDQVGVVGDPQPVAVRGLHA